MKVLITGGSGYLGQFLVHALAKEYEVVYTYNSSPLEACPPGVVACKVNFATGDGLHGAFEGGSPVDAVVNCAAISQPAVCEQDPHSARAVNVPTGVVEQLLAQQASTGTTGLLIHLSTDQVYDGSRAHWREGDACVPVNAYGRSKLEAEEYIQAHYPHHAIMRSSIIYGPPPPLQPVQRTLFLQFVESALRQGKPTTFFHDEWRSPIYVEDIVTIVSRLLQRACAPPHKALYNMGGPERLSRADMAYKVAECLQCSTAAIQPAPSATVTRPVASPPDISMTVDLIQHDLGLRVTPFAEALRAIYSNSHSDSHAAH